MAGDSDLISQAEIEELLKQAQAAARGGAPPPATSPATPSAPKSTAPEPAMLDQNEIEAMMKGAAAAKPAESKPAAASAAAVGPGAVGQDEIEAMLRGNAKPAATATKPPPAPPPAAPKRDVTDDISYLLSQAEEALASVDQPAASNLAGLAPFELHDFGGTPATNEKATLELLRDVELDVKIELGRTFMPLDEVLRLRRGSVVPLDKLAGDPVDVYVNGRLVARGEVLVLNDNFCVRVAELIASEEHKAA
jgi:flagellar motor switch protein FliN/FliY